MVDQREIKKLKKEIELLKKEVRNSGLQQLAFLINNYKKMELPEPMTPEEEKRYSKFLNKFGNITMIIGVVFFIAFYLFLMFSVK